MMLRTLRVRLIFSHVLPLLVILPLMGFVLVYALETRILLPGMAKELEGDATLFAKITRDQTRLWQDPVYAQQILKSVSGDLSVRVMLLNPQGILIASTDSRDDSRINRVLNISGLALLQQGKTVSISRYSQDLNSEVADVLVPVIDQNGKMIGIVRITYPLQSIYQRFIQLRYLVVIVLTAGLIVGAIVGLWLSLDLGKPIEEATQAVFSLTSGGKLEPLPESGPEEIRLLMRSVNSLVVRLRDLEQSRKQLLANLVHELGRPLGALRSGIHALLKGAVRDPALSHELLEGMDEEAARLQVLLDELSRLHEQILGSLELNRKPVSLNDWLPRILAPWRAAAAEKHLKWEVRLQSGLPEVEIDPARIAQAVGNLVSNAIKFTPSSGKVTIMAGHDNHDVWIKVSDTGPGIPADEIEMILKPFYRGRRGRRFPQGMGLGLGITQSLVTAHGGRLEIHSTPGLGSDFIIHLPITDRSSSSASNL
jgi:two-component system sensor histidine kinase BaeS